MRDPYRDVRREHSEFKALFCTAWVLLRCTSRLRRDRAGRVGEVCDVTTWTRHRDFRRRGVARAAAVEAFVRAGPSGFRLPTGRRYRLCARLGVLRTD